MKTKLLLLVAVTLTFSGCMSIAWIGFKKPVESDFVSLNSNDSCMKIGKQNLNNRQEKAVLEAATDVCNIFHSDEFRKRVIAQTWLASCDEENGKPDEISGEEVYKMLMKKISNYSVHPRKPWLAIAQTQRNEIDFVYNRVAIKPKRIEAWYSQVDTIKSELVNTIAHETTHIISFDFADRGHGSEKCPDSRLVSYGIGNLVEELWLKQHKK
jgi:hypothetical protein